MADTESLPVEVRVALVNGSVELAKAALQVAMVANGSAAVAILAFCGSIVAAKEKIPAGVAVALPIFAFGVAMGAIATGIAYLTQYSFGEAEDGANDKRWAAIIFVGIAYGTFVIGAIVAAVSLWHR